MTQLVRHLVVTVLFVHGAFQKELVRVKTYKKKSNTYQALLVEILTRSSLRVEPHCPHFNICSGCNLQHMPYDFQLNLKLESFENSIQKLASTLIALYQS